MTILKPFFKDPVISVITLILLLFGIFILNSLSPAIFPQYYFYIAVSIVMFYIFYFIGFDIFKYFSVHLYIISIFLLLLTLAAGQITRGTLRWIPLGEFSLQTSEIVRPFILLFYASIVSGYKGGTKKLLGIIMLGLIPVLLIAIQPSLGVAIVTLAGLVTIFFIKFINLRSVVVLILISLLAIPATWFLLKPYQKERITVFLNYQKDPKGVGYNEIQSIISVGSGGLFGRGFKKGFQTQLKYLPEKSTDFVFAGISEELGFVGAVSVLTLLFVLFFRVLRTETEAKIKI